MRAKPYVLSTPPLMMAIVSIAPSLGLCSRKTAASGSTKVHSSLSANAHQPSTIAGAQLVKQTASMIDAAALAQSMHPVEPCELLPAGDGMSHDRR